MDEASRSIAEGVMDEHEAYLFDLQGFLAVEAVLSTAEVAELPPNARYRGRRVGMRPGAVS